jgi:arylsulfatase A-like enzyme
MDGIRSAVLVRLPGGLAALTRPVRRATRLAVLVGGLGALLACAPAEAPFPANVVLISIDTLRADRLPTYGYERDTGPSVEALARRSLVFDRAYTEASHTLLAHASLFTGLYPDSHGVIRLEDALAEDVPTLAELLRAAGYRTGAFVNAGLLDPKFGLWRGFDRYDYRGDLVQRRMDGRIQFGRSASQTNAAVLEWLAVEPERPFLLFVHYFDVHSDWRDLPYESPPEFRRRFEASRPAGFQTGNGEFFASLYLLYMNEQGLDYSRADLDYLASLYDGGVAYTDFEVGVLLAALERSGQLERSLVILLSDHGEEFGEHGKLLHDQVYEELVHVPLLLAFPAADSRTQRDFAPRRVGVAAQLVDLLPTVADYLGLDAPEGSQGVSLLRMLDEGDAAQRPVYFRNQSGSQYGLRAGRWKWVARENAGELYDLDDDPRETRDLAPREPAQAARLAALLEDWRARSTAERVTPGPATPLDPGVRRELEALGYVE